MASSLTAAVSTVVRLTPSPTYQGTDSPVSDEKGSSLFVIRWDGATTVGSQEKERGLGPGRPGGS